eukprot:1767082-Amphidinium_carterae.1
MYDDVYDDGGLQPAPKPKTKAKAGATEVLRLCYGRCCWPGGRCEHVKPLRLHARPFRKKNDSPQILQK